MLSSKAVLCFALFVCLPVLSAPVGYGYSLPSLWHSQLTNTPNSYLNPRDARKTPYVPLNRMENADDDQATQRKRTPRFGRSAAGIGVRHNGVGRRRGRIGSEAPV
ncbi:uncharacterized protein LAESUDRAFT_499127 [Laetiporus sulphureus 93-53]|uniref:Secreted protein n=1 Tax=Laetiporus sulphureus 93-53 TaxID=1314785 RepID=A0A165BHK4_9APHY|nr:uncharacterized protein LAESUDRAFT_499127 [Laetiporus sulphureus 93-53]KZT01070.1 hypothetical protein LAESUDRAFT_499127 [Laetiporus sulphureus 93-53]